jgi:NADPH-dependent 2,4-dienoyl-CoA reductase/sulfur reductase-like enzyme
MPEATVTLIEPKNTYTACPLSNLVLAGERNIKDQRFTYHAMQALGIDLMATQATDVDPVKRTVRIAEAREISYDRLVMAPGIAIDWDALPGYGENAAESMPHAWQAGPQTVLLRDQLTSMPDGGLVVLSVPESPYRCPPGPYERASLIASYLKRSKARAKILILDAKDNFSKKPLFIQGWSEIYGDMVEWIGVSDGGRVVSVDAPKGQLQTDFDTFDADVANVIPPQRAGLIAARAGVTDASGWCPVEPVTFESRLQPGIHVIGDAAIANAMPKSAFAANAQAKLCAVQVARLLRGEAPAATKLINTCYSLISPDYGVSVAGVYRPTPEIWSEVEGAGGISPLNATMETRRLEAAYARQWFSTLTTQVFG